MSQDETPKEKRRFKGTRRIYTFGVLLSASDHTLDHAQRKVEGEFYDSMSSMLSSAFALEAYLNHLGAAKFGQKEWERIERGMSTESKLRVLAKIINYNIDFGKRPFQTFMKMLKYRNTIVHARTETLTYDEEQEYGPRERPAHPETWWEQATTLKTAERFYEDARELVRQLHEAAGLPEHQLWSAGDGERRELPPKPTAPA